jgi:hypothetical protein
MSTASGPQTPTGAARANRSTSYGGNLNYSVPLTTAIGRGGLKATFNLNYNSQNWVQVRNRTPNPDIGHYRRTALP